MDFLTVLKEKRELVWPEIEKYLNSFFELPEFCRLDKKYQKILNFHQKMVMDYPRRQGKYVRPTLLLLTGQAMGVNPKKMLKTAMAMQISEDWILMHDDIEDDSKQRRGNPAIHKIYGKELAINAGDALQTAMWQLIGEIDNKQIRDEFATMIKRTILGQTMEIKWTQENKLDMSLADVLLILESKTAYYTIAGPMRLGAILGGANQKQLEAIYEFGKPLGYCFQIRDDLLDLTSDFEGKKKQLGNDIYEGKRTVMLVNLLKKIKGEEKKKLIEILKKNREEKNEVEVAWVISKMKEHGCLKYGQKLATKYAQEAREIFEKKLGFLDQEPVRSQLMAGIDFILNRGS